MAVQDLADLVDLFVNPLERGHLNDLIDRLLDHRCRVFVDLLGGDQLLGNRHMGDERHRVVLGRDMEIIIHLVAHLRHFRGQGQPAGLHDHLCAVDIQRFVLPRALAAKEGLRERTEDWPVRCCPARTTPLRGRAAPSSFSGRPGGRATARWPAARPFRSGRRGGQRPQRKLSHGRPGGRVRADPAPSPVPCPAIRRCHGRTASPLLATPIARLQGVPPQARPWPIVQRSRLRHNAGRAVAVGLTLYRDRAARSPPQSGHGAAAGGSSRGCHARRPAPARA